LAGVLIATLRTGNSSYGGVTRAPELVPGVTGFEDWRLRPAGCETFDDLLEYWQQNLAALGQRYRAGEVSVDPRQPPKTCQYCHLSVLCRIDELRGVAEDLEEPDRDD
jgi:hypothetical protein